MKVYLFLYHTHNGKQDDPMTDKELRKLSRLELLELLLKESSENQKLREELDKLKSEKTIEHTAERLTETADNLASSIQNIENYITVIQNIVADKNTESANDSEKESETEVIEETETSDSLDSGFQNQKKISEDADIYRRFMQFFYYNRNNLVFLPDDLRQDVTRRLSEIMQNAQSNKTDID